MHEILKYPTLHMRFCLRAYEITTGHAVALLVEALCYKPEGRGIEPR
jgi:hypothetical protein